MIADCHIIGRPVGAVGGRENGAVADRGMVYRGDDVICGAPDDLHYELELMLDMENEMEVDVQRV